MQLNICQMVRQNSLYSAPAMTENKDKLQNREQEGTGKRFEDVSWAAVVQYSETSGYIWTSPLRSGPCQDGPFPPPFLIFHQSLTNNTNFSTWWGRMRTLRVRISNARASAASSVSLSCCSCGPCETPRPSRGERAYAHLCLSLSLILTCVSSSAQRPPVRLPVSLLPLLRKRSS